MKTPASLRRALLVEVAVGGAEDEYTRVSVSICAARSAELDQATGTAAEAAEAEAEAEQRQWQEQKRKQICRSIPVYCRSPRRVQ